MPMQSDSALVGNVCVCGHPQSQHAGRAMLDAQCPTACGEWSCECKAFEPGLSISDLATLRRLLQDEADSLAGAVHNGAVALELEDRLARVAAAGRILLRALRSAGREGSASPYTGGSLLFLSVALGACAADAQAPDCAACVAVFPVGEEVLSLMHPSATVCGETVDGPMCCTLTTAECSPSCCTPIPLPPVPSAAPVGTQ